MRAYTVAEDGKLKLRPERHTVNTATKTDRAARASGCGGEVKRAGAARRAEWALRLSLATAFLSAVGDRLGAWGPHGSPHASWGDWHHFRIYADQLNWYMPAAVQPAAAVLATAGEVIFAIALITGFRLCEAAIGSGVLLTILGISMALILGMKAPLDYSVFTAATASFSLAAMAADHKREHPRGRKS